MNRIIAIALSVALSACAWYTQTNSRDNRLLRMNQGGLILSMAMLTCDEGGTLRASERGWRMQEEGGFPARAIMGATPSSTTVIAYHAAAALVVLGLSRVLPEYIRPFLYGGVIAAESLAIGNNVGKAGPCGIPIGGMGDR